MQPTTHTRPVPSTKIKHPASEHAGRGVLSSTLTVPECSAGILRTGISSRIPFAIGPSLDNRACALFGDTGTDVELSRCVLDTAKALQSGVHGITCWLVLVSLGMQSFREQSSLFGKEIAEYVGGGSFAVVNALTSVASSTNMRITVSYDGGASCDGRIVDLCIGDGGRIVDPWIGDRESIKFSSNHLLPLVHFYNNCILC